MDINTQAQASLIATEIAGTAYGATLLRPDAPTHPMVAAHVESKLVSLGLLRRESGLPTQLGWLVSSMLN